MVPTAFSKCVQNIGFIRRLVARRLPFPGIVEDVVQEVVAAFLAKADQWELKDDIRPLLAGIARKIIASHWREQAKRSPEVIARIAERLQRLNSEDISSATYDTQIDALKQCLENLPEHGRDLIDMYYFEDMPTESIAETMNMKTGTVNRSIYRLREKLRGCIENRIGKEVLQ